MIIMQFYLFLFVFAASVMCAAFLFHTTFSAGLAVSIPQGNVRELTHAVVQSERCTGSATQVHQR